MRWSEDDPGLQGRESRLQGREETFMKSLPSTLNGPYRGSGPHSLHPLVTSFNRFRRHRKDNGLRTTRSWGERTGVVGVFDNGRCTCSATGKIKRNPWRGVL